MTLRDNLRHATAMLDRITRELFQARVGMIYERSSSIAEDARQEWIDINVTREECGLDPIPMNEAERYPGQFNLSDNA